MWMKRALVALLATSLLGLEFAMLTPSFAAGIECRPGEIPKDLGAGVICIPASSGPSGPPTGGGGSSAPRVCKSASGAAVQCEHPVLGSWSQANQCYLRLMSPQPASDDPVWTSPIQGGGPGKGPETGRIYLCTGLPSGGLQGSFEVYIDGAGPPDPRVLAQQALGQLTLAVPQIGLAPAPPARTYVGLDTWLWVPQDQWVPLTGSVTAGTTTVTVTAVPRQVSWDMGPETRVCAGPGRVWRVGQMESGAQTACSYTYSRVSDFEPGGVFPVTAVIVYEATWTCSGECSSTGGSLGPVRSLPSSSQLVVGERQSVLINPRKDRTS